MKIKVCGMREPENILGLLALPIDYIGFILYEKSPRFAGKSKLAPWLEKHSDRFEKVKKVGVFVNAEVEQILNAVHDYQLDFVQLHGDESPEYCRELVNYWEITSMRRAGLIKAFHVDGSFNFRLTQAYERFCSLFIFDTRGSDYGGTGLHFNWQLMHKYTGIRPYLLSGGIDEADVPALRELNFKQMIGVDINSRFETSPGLKDIQKISRFLSVLNA